ncbi:MAG: class I poly(R)-hydroxyalkanoic acid synthase [Rhodospirillales bacterium CG15_BIG_FIL_POST_REV_8_21_14_020_66_15]|nr:MAG: class I poly(R)-hydroxyalkanoic acid synthase [Rhodospirillales bacterium CG15_BIG_FIL_POST_REV_8_21_14_020_66_15]
MSKTADRPTEKTAAKEPPAASPFPDTEEAQRAAQALNERCQRIVQRFWERQAEQHGFQIPDPLVIGKAFFELGAAMLQDPAKLAEAQARLWQGYAELFDAASKRLKGEAAAPVAEPAKDDKRFKDEAWSENVVFDTLKQSYLLTSNWIREAVHDVEGLDPKTREKVNFYTRQWVNALAPTNFAATNPKVIQRTLDTKGDNLVKGLDHLLEDLERGEGQLRISMTDDKAFKLGENIAVSPGKVVFQNDLMQLIQYAPTTETVFKRPLLIVPPWINKFYILDLQPKNSFIKWAVDQGHTTFVVSWVNPDERLSHKTFADYMLEGPLAAMDAIKDATGEDSVNLIGYCIGGTLTAATLAWMAAQPSSSNWGGDRVASATFFTTMTDFKEPGELGVFIDEEQLDLLEQHMAEKGFLEGSHMSQVFNMMRDNDLIWSFVVNNYLLGREPMAFDLLYWNSDSTRMPAMMHGMYLRKMYLENKLVEPGGITLAGTPIDLAKVKTPAYLLSTHDDHIAPWKSTYKATQLYSGPIRFVLSASGHIAGVINPPAANKYCYWTKTGKPPRDPDKWFAGAARNDGSWWPDWQTWVAKKSGGRVAARRPGDGGLKALEDAPGSYVAVRLG